eukprot:COSAG06_NODE_2695_length_6438_cov_8.469475_6_plen_205_part_00
MDLEIAESERKDTTDFIEKMIGETQVAAAGGNAKEVSRCVKVLSGKSSNFSTTRPTACHCCKTPLDGDEAAVNYIAGFAEDKFMPTAAERERGPLPVLPARPSDVPTYEELELCLASMKRSKAAGWDDMPIEYFKDSETLKREIFELVQQMWETEEIPEEIVRGVFVPICPTRYCSSYPGLRARSARGAGCPTPSCDHYDSSKT